MHDDGDHPFLPGIDVDAPDKPDPRWCNTCGEGCDGSLTSGLLGHYEDRCPGCGEALYDGVCQFTYTTWRCSGCGATIDSRVLMPKQVHR